MGTFSLKQDRRTYFSDPPGEKLPMSVWLKPGQKPIKLSAAAKVDLARAIGEKNMRVLDAGIGFAPGRETEQPRVDPIFRYETAWQTAPRPVFKQNTIVKKNEQGGAFLSNPCTVRGKFFWPDMTNENINGQWKKHPMELQMPGAVRDLRSWLSMYGEPDPGKIPTGTMTTFVPSRKHLGTLGRSQTCAMATKVDGYSWHDQYVDRMKKQYGNRFQVKAEHTVRPPGHAKAGKPASDH